MHFVNVNQLRKEKEKETRELLGTTAFSTYMGEASDVVCFIAFNEGAQLNF